MEHYYGGAFYDQQWPDPDAVWATNATLYKEYELPLMTQLWKDWPPPAGGSVAEIGCGYGVMLALLREAGYRVRGCDPSSKAAAFCRTKGLDVAQGKSPGIPLPVGAFDISVAMHVIEHVPDPVPFIKELVGLVRPGGVIVVVSEDGWTSQYAWERLRAQMCRRIPPFHSSTDHTFVFRARHLRSLLTEAGCDVVRTEAFSYIPVNESFHWKLYKGVFRTLDRFCGHGDYLMAVGRRKPGKR